MPDNTIAMMAPGMMMESMLGNRPQVTNGRFTIPATTLQQLLAAPIRLHCPDRAAPVAGSAALEGDPRSVGRYVPASQFEIGVARGVEWTEMRPIRIHDRVDAPHVGGAQPPRDGEAVAVACDSQDRVYVFLRGSQPVQVFERDGILLAVSEYARRAPQGVPQGPHQGLDVHGRQAPVNNSPEDDQLEIPAFLRRQAN